MNNKANIKTSSGISFQSNSLPYKIRKTLEDDSKDFSFKSQLNELINELPQDSKKQFLIEKSIQKTYSQFEQLVNESILLHVNSVYLLKTNSVYNLVVYVDNSLVAAELNARRELIKYKYKDLFNIDISDFDIRISRGRYLNKYPFRDRKQLKNKMFHVKHQLSEEELIKIDNLVSQVKDKELRESFRKVLIAQKQQN